MKKIMNRVKNGEEKVMNRSILHVYMNNEKA